jgi:tRNA 2-thiouridine synthesizing protein A
MKEQMVADVTVDSRGIAGPMPVIMSSQAVMSASWGGSVESISPERGSCSAVSAWPDDMDHELEEQFAIDGDSPFVIQKSR